LSALPCQDQGRASAQADVQVSPAKPKEPRTTSANTAKKTTAPFPAPSEAHTTKAPSRRQKSAASQADLSPRKPGDLGEVRVRTKAEMRKPRSPFLLPPGAVQVDRYGGSPDEVIDWNDLPPWRQASFFGMQARGQFFVYVVDCSESMIEDDRLARATIELRRSVFALREPQRFEVIFYNTESIPMPGGPRPRTADLQAKNQLLAWLRLIEPLGGTDPRPALKQALGLRPDAVFLLSDGEFPGRTAGEVARLNTRQIPIHCVDVTGGLAGDQLKQIAAASGGQYASRPGDLQARP
jgi:hypothetical protein